MSHKSRGLLKLRLYPAPSNVQRFAVISGIKLPIFCRLTVLSGLKDLPTEFT